MKNIITLFLVLDTGILTYVVGLYTLVTEK